MEVKKYNQMMSYLTRPKKRPDRGKYGEEDGRIIAGEERAGKLTKPLTPEQKEILEDVYKVKTFEAAKKKFGITQAFDIVNRIRTGQAYKGMKSPIVQGFGKGMSIPTEQSPEAKKIIVAELNKLKVMKNNRAFFDFKEGDKWYKNLSKRLDNLSREPLNRAIKTIAQEEFPNSYIGSAGKKRYRQEMVVKTFIDSLEVNNGFTGNEKFSDVLKEFRGSEDHRFEQINKDFRAWVKGEYEVDGVDRSKLTPEQLKEIKNYKRGNQKQIRSVNKEQQLKWMHGANDRFKNLTASEVEKKFFRKFPDAPKNAFLQRSNELVQIKRTGSVISGADSTIEYKWAKTEPDNRSKWLKQSYGKQFGGNYGAILRRADEFRQAGNIEDAIRLEKAADKYFGPKGVFRKATGEGEHPFSRIMGGADQELKINSLVRGDLNQFKRVNFDQPVIQLLNKYKLTKPGSVARQKIIDEIEDRKKLMNLLTETKSEKGIVDAVKFNYGQTKIGPSTQVVPIDKLDEMGKFNLQDFVVRGQNYLEGFQTAAQKAPVLMKGEKITTKKFKGQELQNLLAALGCGSDRLPSQAGGTPTRECILAGANKINNPSLIKPGAETRNATQFLNRAAPIGRAVMKFGVIPEAIWVAGASLYDMGRGAGLSEALLRGSDYLLPGNQGKMADRLKFESTVGKENAETILRAKDYKKSLEQLATAKSNLETNQAVLDESDFSYTGNVDAQNQLEVDKQFIKAAEQNVKNKYQRESVLDQAVRSEMEAEDIRGTRDPFYKAMVNARSAETDDFETLFTPEKKQKGVAPPMLTLDDIALANVPDAFLEAERAKIGDAPELTKRNVLDFYRTVETDDGSRPVNEIIFRELFRNARDSSANQERFLGTQGIFARPVIDDFNIRPPRSYIQSPFQREEENRLIEEGARFGAAGGGIMKLAGIDKGPQITSMNPDSGGLDSLRKNVKKL
jgi:hypothetical protein